MWGRAEDRGLHVFFALREGELASFVSEETRLRGASAALDLGVNAVMKKEGLRGPFATGSSPSSAASRSDARRRA